MLVFVLLVEARVVSFTIPYDEAKVADMGAVRDFTVVPINANYLFAVFEVDVGERTVAALGADALDPTLVLVEVYITDHLVVLNSACDVVDAVVPVLAVVERVRVKHNRWLLLVKLSRKEGTGRVEADQLNSRDHS